MRNNELVKPTVPISYVLLLLDVIADYGVSRELMLMGLGIPDEILRQPNARISLLDEYARFCDRALELTGEPALAYEFGLRSSVTTHGLLGYGLMSQPTLRHTFNFADRFADVLRMPAWEFRFLIEKGFAIVDGREAISHGHLRRFSCEQFVLGVSSIIRDLVGEDAEQELFFDYPEPEYHARYRHRLPHVTFDSGLTRVQIPEKYLDHKLRTADQVAAKIAERECERELAFLEITADPVKQVRAVLTNDNDGYPGLETVAKRLHMTSRTLVRRLSERSTSFRQLLDEARRRDCSVLIDDPRLTIAEIAYRLGYSSSANFARAFRAWYGRSPGQSRSG